MKLSREEVWRFLVASISRLEDAVHNLEKNDEEGCKTHIEEALKFLQTLKEIDYNLLK